MVVRRQGYKWHARARLLARRSNLRGLLSDRSISQDEFAALMGWSAGYVSQLIGGVQPTRWITERTALRIEEALGLALGTLDKPLPSRRDTNE